MCIICIALQASLETKLRNEIGAFSSRGAAAVDAKSRVAASASSSRSPSSWFLSSFGLGAAAKAPSANANSSGSAAAAAGGASTAFGGSIAANLSSLSSAFSNAFSSSSSSSSRATGGGKAGQRAPANNNCYEYLRMKGPHGRGHAEIAVCAAPLDDAPDEGPDRRRMRAKTPDPEGTASATAQMQQAALFSSMSAADSDERSMTGNPFSSSTQSQTHRATGGTHGSGYVIRRLMRKACSHAGRLDTDPPVSTSDMFLYPGDAPWKQQTTLTRVPPSSDEGGSGGGITGPLSPSADIEGRSPIDGASYSSRAITLYSSCLTLMCEYSYARSLRYSLLQS